MCNGFLVLKECIILLTYEAECVAFEDAVKQLLVLR